MATVFANTAFNMKAENVFVTLAHEALPDFEVKGGKIVIDPDYDPQVVPSTDQKAFFAFYNMDEKKHSYDSLAFYGVKKLTFGKIAIPGFDFDLFGPTKGKLDAIFSDHFDGKKWQNNFGITDLNLDVAVAKSKIISLEYFTKPDQYFKGLKSLYEGLFAQDDHITGSKFADTLLGFDGDDVLEGGAGSDTLDGGAGIDRADYHMAAGRVSVSLDKNFANFERTNGNGGRSNAGDKLVNIEGLRGSNFNDTLRGDEKANTIGGWLGKDTLFGGAGADTFVFSADVTPANVDIIGDFDARAGAGHGRVYDLIELNFFEFNALALERPSKLVDGVTSWDVSGKEFFASANGKALNADTKLLYNTTNGQLLYDFDGNGAGKAVVVARIYADYDEQTGKGVAAQGLTEENFKVKYDFTPDF